MPLTPKLQEYVEFVEKLKERLFSSGFEPNQMNEREAIAAFCAMYMTEHHSDIKTIDDTLIRDGYPIAIRLYSPNFAEKLPVVVYIHGGGHMTGGISVYDKIVKKLSKKTGSLVVSIEYRLSPEFAYPIGLGDCKAVISEIFDVLKKRGVAYEADEIAIVGDSSGGTFCASIAGDESFALKHKIKKQILIAPLLDYTLGGNSAKEYAEGYLLDIRELNFYFSNYFQNGDDRRAASPLFGRFYPKMPRTLILAAEYDPLYSDASSYHRKLQEAGAESVYREIKSVVHPFLMLEDLCKDEVNGAYEFIGDFLKGNV